MKDTKHFLACCHCIGGNNHQYNMACDILKPMHGERLKIRVYGRLYWPGNDHIEQIRYVPATRVFERTLPIEGK